MLSNNELKDRCLKLVNDLYDGKITRREYLRELYGLGSIFGKEVDSLKRFYMDHGDDPDGYAFASKRREIEKKAFTEGGEDV